MIKTAIENRQNLIVEGCYVPPDWSGDLEEEYLSDIRFVCLCFSDSYISGHIDDITAYASCVEKRISDDCCTGDFLKEGSIIKIGGTWFLATSSSS